MCSQIEVLHFGYQCPWVDQTIENLEKYTKNEKILFNTLDVSMNRHDRKIVFPFMIAVDGQVTTGSPVYPSNVSDLLKKEYNGFVKNETDMQDDDLDIIRSLDSYTIDDSIRVCCNNEKINCRKKPWYVQNSDFFFGYVGYKNNKPVCMIDIIESDKFSCFDTMQCNKIIHILCVYSNDKKYNYIKSMFKMIIPELSDKYDGMQIIVAENSCYPNGDIALFENIGFVKIKNLGSTYLLKKGYDNIFLMFKLLR